MTKTETSALDTSVIWISFGEIPWALLPQFLSSFIGCSDQALLAKRLSRSAQAQPVNNGNW